MSLFSRKRVVSRGGAKTDMPEGLWIKCEGCRQTVYRAEFEENDRVCPACGRHFRISASRRLAITVDEGSFRETHKDVVTADPLDFHVGEESYLQRVARAREKSGLDEALLTGMACIGEREVALGIMESEFMMGSMGAVVGEKFCRLAEDAITRRCPLVVFTASGGARMQEGTLALMQMAKTANAVRELQQARLPYITILTDPTTGGVWASFASLGDIVLAEPGAYVGFAGKRLIEGSLKIKLPEGFQTAEYQLKNGFVDAIVKRHEMRQFLVRLVAYLEPVNKRGVSQPESGGGHALP
ncbi:MAG: acetyl-CoA carboxylase carboxyltransferase subunit beta [Candidatus Hydrogenedentes bacterium]|jgi:acetyl-CoA carboxylase carboxyl transferase subunit beta|nr:acetyl-CoA carboxylase carboxyltransferase subunit beta [Candidatus Hydrogenedentota bacterium]